MASGAGCQDLSMVSQMYVIKRDGQKQDSNDSRGASQGLRLAYDMLVI